MGRGRERRIGHTQPRRIAARATAARIAEELGSPLGEVVGYKVRFHETLRAGAAIKLMTDGILLAETQTDRRLDAREPFLRRLQAHGLAGRPVDLGDEGRGGDGEGVAVTAPATRCKSRSKNSEIWS